ncbi:hypothetical protein KI688_000660 [Linnemannia hyalina]|uniref:F-box domain-containing protein n=1 Tax=Linnemannia hyalina TaxID=64524 RepID=A0A9P8BXQ1_9FUNG|nr:hypothetical protein KI688_000660 [Linnemannia hyalina]
MQARFVDFSELLIHLVTYLYPPDLLSCVQVNRTWHQVFIPVLWRSIDDSTHCWVDLKKYIPPKSKPPWEATHRTLSPQDKDKDKDESGDSLFAAFAKYGHHILELKIH